MSKQNPSNSDDKTATKKAAVLGAEKKTRHPLVVTLLAVLAVAGVGYLLLGKQGAPPQAAAAPTPAATSSQLVAFPIADFADGKARYFQLDGGKGVTIRYYVVKAPDGLLRTAFDACDACWAEGKGYQQEGTAMICRNCRRSFDILKIGEVHGGCNPAPLKSHVNGGTLEINASDILAGRHYFDLPKRTDP